MSLKFNRSAFLFLFFISPIFLISSAFGQQATFAVVVDFDRLWVDYDVTEGGDFGMRIHVSLTTRNLQEVSTKLAVAVELRNGDKVFAGSNAYRSTNGQLTVYRVLNTRFIHSVFKDVQVFIPYREFSVGAGPQNLRLHVDVLYENSGNKHVTYYNFSFTK